MKNEHLGVGILLRDPYYSCQGLFVCFEFVTAGIVVEVVTVTVYDAHNWVLRLGYIFQLLSYAMNREVGAAWRQKHNKRRITNAHEKHRMQRAHDRSAVWFSHIEHRICSLADRLLYDEYNYEDDQQ